MEDCRDRTQRVCLSKNNFKKETRVARKRNTHGSVQI